jgi:putative oxidoreductase
MIVAVLTVHLKNGFFNTNGGFEFNLALAGMALTLLIIGAGAYSLDSALGILW